MKRPLSFVFALVLAAAALALAAGDVPVVNPTEPRLLRAGPIVGYGGSDAVTLWVSPPTPSAKVEVAIRGEEVRYGEMRVTVPSPAPGALGAKVGIPLAGNGHFSYRVLVDGKSDASSEGAFTTPPEPGTPVKATIAVVSCNNVRRYPSQPAWATLGAEKPALLLLLGDNVYADSTDPAIQNGWFLAQRRVPQYAAVARVTPTLAIWDDHDFGANDSDGTLPGKERNLETFRSLWPNPSPGGLEGTPGVFFKTSYGDVDIFMLDTRYHRSPNFDPDDEKKTMLGAAQWAWFERELRASKARFKLVASGSTISASFKDCWLLYTRDRNRLVGLTKEIAGIVFLTGDIHTALVGRSDPGAAAGYPVYEVVSSGIAVNPSFHFFVTLDVDTMAKDATIAANVFKCDGQGRVLERKVTTIKRSELEPAF